MESNIDPSITEHDIFLVSRSIEDDNKHMVYDNGGGHHEHGANVSIPNVFELNDYVEQEDRRSDHVQLEHDSDAAAALNMINFNALGDHDEERAYNGGVGSFRGIQGMDALEPSGGNGDANVSSIVKVVPYNPKERTKRLGRPRRNMINSLTTPENSSTKNYNEAVLSKFRLDRLPLEGPGSRGGRAASRKGTRGRITTGLIKKRKQQALLSSKSCIDDNGNVVSKVVIESSPLKMSDEDTTSTNISVQEAQVDISDKQVLGQNNHSTAPASDGFILENTVPVEGPENETPSSLSDSNLHQLTNHFSDTRSSTTPQLTTSVEKTPTFNGKTKRENSRLASTSRTTVLSNKLKANRSLPGPVTGLYYDFYDDNIINAKQNVLSLCEKIALGFPVRDSPTAKDITVIILFLNKFKDVVFGSNVTHIGPQDIEEGIHLRKEDSDQMEAADDIRLPVSQLMISLFCKLLGLVLNRKKEINPHQQSNAIQELKSMLSGLGLPIEWRENASNIVELLEVARNPMYPLNPFKYSPEFEVLGFAGILRPIDRLIMLKSLVKWALFNSESIKSTISLKYLSRELYGERETNYASRYILRGPKGIDACKRNYRSKFLKKSRTPDSDNTSDNALNKYLDPATDPLEHGTWLRLNDFVVGDVGFGIGRFYLCRMAEPNNGGLATVSKMELVLSNETVFNSPAPSKFKLYVQDVHLMLVESLTEYGVEFNEMGEEIQNANPKGRNIWFEVASNVHELVQFVKFVTLKLGLDFSEDVPDRISSNSMIYKPLLNLRNYLHSLIPLLTKQELLYQDSRRLRKVTSTNNDIQPSVDSDYSEDGLAEADNNEDEDYEDEEEEEEDIDIDHMQYME